MASRYDIPIIRISRYRDLAIVHCRSTLQNEAIIRRTDVLEKRKSNGVVDGVSYDGGRRNGRVRQVTIKRIRSFDGRASGPTGRVHTPTRAPSLSAKTIPPVRPANKALPLMSPRASIWNLQKSGAAEVRGKRMMAKRMRQKTRGSQAGRGATAFSAMQVCQSRTSKLFKASSQSYGNVATT